MRNLLCVAFASLCCVACAQQSVSIEDSLSALLSADYRNLGFVVFEGRTEGEYVQYGLEREGLLLVWPIIEHLDGHTLESITIVEGILTEHGYSEVQVDVVTRQVVLDLEPYEYTKSSNELLAIVGRDPEHIGALTRELFQLVYGFAQFDRIETELVLDNSR